MVHAVELGFRIEVDMFVCNGYPFLGDSSQYHHEEPVARGVKVVGLRFSYKPFKSTIWIPLFGVGSFLVRSDGICLRRPYNESSKGKPFEKTSD